MTSLFAFIERHCAKALLIAGGISATGFAPLNWWPLTLLCLALLMHWVAKAESGKRAFLLGWAFGVGHFTIGNNWIATAFTYQAAMPVWLGWCAVPLIALYLAIYPGLAAWGAWWLRNSANYLSTRHSRESGNPSPATSSKPTGSVMGSRFRGSDEVLKIDTIFILFFAGCWIITEWLRAWVFTGFSWNPLGITFPGAIYATWVGSYGLAAFAIALAGILLLLINRNLKGVLILAGLILLPYYPTTIANLGWTKGYLADVVQKQGLEPANLTIVQPNISQIDKYAPGYDAINFRRLAENSLSRDTKPRLLLWPEAAIPWRLEDGYPYRFYQFQPGESAEGARTMLTRLMNPGDLLLTGVDRLEFDKDRQLVGARNSMTAMDASGKILGNYDKAHLVPYGEYLALRWLLEPLGAARLVPGDLDFWPGPGPRTLDLPFNGRRVKVGMQICYEIIFSGEVVDRTHRPDFIFNPSNDAWFGGWGSPQFVAQARLRAIEEGLPVVRATPTGISAVIDADGRIIKSLPRGIAGRIDAQLPLPKEPTLFARYGNTLSLAFAALLIAFGLLPLARRSTYR
ncbi:MAG: apolipoprotein N-acyltransferase [Sphingorhabdus sp.]|uniref:apolipoprotein N-acyltransferase n=1 Tax=Sphingorhabdus sp. TaxID=1902408 RepID=UPI003C9CBFBF